MLVQTALIALLGAFPVQDPDEDLEALKKELQTITPDEKARIPTYGWRLPIDKARSVSPQIGALLKHPDREGRLKGLMAVQLLYPEGLGEDVKRLLRDPDPGVAGSAIDTVCNNRLEGLYPALLDVLKTGPTETRAHAAEALATIQYPASIPALLAAAQDKEFEVAVSAGRSLGKLRAPQAVPILLGWLKVKTDLKRFNGIEALRELGDRRAAAALRAALSDADVNIRSSATAGLVSVVGKDAIPDLVKALADPSDQVQWAAISGLGALNAKPHAAAIAKLLDNEKVAAAVLEALLLLDAQEALPAVIKKFDHRDVQVRMLAVETAARLGGPYAVKALREGLEGKDPFVRYQSMHLYFATAPLSEIRALLRDRQSDFLFVDNQREDLLSFELNRLRAPQVWDKLRGTPLEGGLAGSAKEIAEIIAKRGGLKLVPPVPKGITDAAWPLGRLEIRNPANRMTLLDALRALQDVQSHWTWQVHFSGFWSYTLEGDELRVESRHMAVGGRTVWADWLKEFAAQEK